MNWFAISQADYFDEEFYVGTLKEVDEELLSYNKQLAVLKKENKLHDDVGPCQTSIDKTLKELGVDRQAYFGGSIIDNHCDKMLKDDNIDILCSSMPVIVESNIHNVADLYQNALICCEKFSILFKKYGNVIAPLILQKWWMLKNVMNWKEIL